MPFTCWHAEGFVDKLFSLPRPLFVRVWAAYQTIRKYGRIDESISRQHGMQLSKLVEFVPYANIVTFVDHEKKSTEVLVYMIEEDMLQKTGIIYFVMLGDLLLVSKKAILAEGYKILDEMRKNHDSR